MELKKYIEYDQILKLIHQLPLKEIELLINTLQSEVSSKKLYKIDELISRAPTWSESDYNEYKEARDLINNSRIS